MGRLPSVDLDHLPVVVLDPPTDLLVVHEADHHGGLRFHVLHDVVGLGARLLGGRATALASAGPSLALPLRFGASFVGVLPIVAHGITLLLRAVAPGRHGPTNYMPGRDPPAPRRLSGRRGRAPPPRRRSKSP